MLDITNISNHQILRREGERIGNFYIKYLFNIPILSNERTQWQYFAISFTCPKIEYLNPDHWSGEVIENSYVGHMQKDVVLFLYLLSSI